MRHAAQRFQVSRAKLAKDIASGAVSAARDGAGNWRIDAAELARVYAARGGLDRPKPVQIGHPRPPGEPSQSDGETVLALRLARAEAELAAERDKVALLERHLQDVRRLLPAPEGRKRSRWWPW